MKFSIITPVYNAEKYLKKCIDSVLEQTYHDWELILINDGSTDGSFEIIEDVRKKDERIIAIHQTNSGPGPSRNRGLDCATGEYIVFLDSDDYIDEDYLKLVASKSKIYDVIFIDVLQVSEENRIIKSEFMSRYRDMDKDDLLRSQMTGKLPWGGVRKVVSRELIQKNKIRYSHLMNGEEALFSFRVLYLASNISFLDNKPVYFYVNHEGSQSKLNLIDPWGEVVINLRTYITTHNLYAEYGNTLNSFNMMSTGISLDRICKIYTGKECMKLAKNRINIFLKTLDRNQGIDYSNLDYRVVFLSWFLVRGAVLPLVLASKIKRILNNIL